MTDTTQEYKIMALVRLLRTGQVTLPAELRRRFKLGAGDYLEAAATDEGILLRPVSVVDREKAWRQVLEIVEEDKWIGPEPRPSPEEEEQQIYDIVEEFRHRHG
jgi:AbrB family looped-hinge helix DNA binding protein